MSLGFWPSSRAQKLTPASPIAAATSLRSGLSEATKAPFSSSPQDSRPRWSRIAATALSSGHRRSSLQIRAHEYRAPCQQQWTGLGIADRRRSRCAALKSRPIFLRSCRRSGSERYSVGKRRRSAQRPRGLRGPIAAPLSPAWESRRRPCSPPSSSGISATLLRRRPAP